MSAQKEWQSDGSESTGTKLSMECCNMEGSFSWSGSKFGFEVEKELCDGDWKAEMDLEGEAKPVKNEYECTGKVKFSSPDFSGARLWCNLALVGTMADAQRSWNLEKKVNISYEDEYHLGWRLKHDTAKVCEGFAQAVWTPKDKKDTAFWLRGDMNQNMVSAGTSYKYGWVGCDVDHSWEASFGTQAGSIDGIMGHPVILRGGYKCRLDENTKHGMYVKVGKDLEIVNKNRHKIDKNWSFGFKQRFDSSMLESKPYDIGFSMTYKL